MGFLAQTGASIRIVMATLVVCSLVYPLGILAVGQVVTPFTANGSLVVNDHNEVIGSELIGQGFRRPEYFWPRPSAVDYNASAAGGSNWSPTNPELFSRAKNILTDLGVSGEMLVPADLVTASGSGLDPHITQRGAQFQVSRVAAARNLSPVVVMDLVKKHTHPPGWRLIPEPIVNVLSLNRALDALGTQNE